MKNLKNNIDHYMSLKGIKMYSHLLKHIIDILPEDTPILICASKLSEVETTSVQYHSDGRIHVILSDEE